VTDTIWLVSQGDYSDYRIVAAFSTEEAATAHVEEWNELGGEDRDARGYAISVDPPQLVVHHTAGWSNHSAGFGNRDNVWTSKAIMEPDDPVRDLDTLSTYDWADGSVSISCVSLDRDRAVKIVADTRAKIKAQEAGL